MQQIARFFQDTFHFLSSIVRPTARSLRDNKGLAALSIVMAFGLWIFVTQAESPSRTRVVPEDIVVEPIHVADTVAVVQPLPVVRARVTVADNVFDSLSAADFQATVDLDGYTVGDYDVTVQVQALTGRGGLRVEEVLPSKIHVTLAQLKSKGVPVVLDAQGDPVSGYTMGSPVLADNTVLVSGPQAQVDQVTQATATFDVSGLTDNVDQSVRLVPRNDKRELIEGVTLTPALTGVTIHIQQQKFSRSMAVSPQITGVPADGYNVVSVSVSPPAVTVSGTQAFVTGTTSVATKPIDISGVTADVVKTVSLNLASGVEVTGGAPTVTITVKVAPATGVFTFSVPVTAINLGSGVSISGALPSVTVTLFGPLPALEGLSPNDIPAVIDLSGDDAGTKKKQIKVTPTTGATVRAVSPSEIEVTLGNR
ncbi:MAG TPA: CdaR family protein [Dehalococcoidia bacterium]|jgi:YbbR domain-containing protein